MNRINREDMMELTRRMTATRNCFSRVAGAYFDEEGYVDGTFHTHFLKLQPRERDKNLAIAKAIPFGETNVKLKEYRFTAEDQKPGGIWQLFMALREKELKDDVLLDTFYEYFGERYRSDAPFAVRIYYGTYDVPLKAKDKESLRESEEVYRFMICAVCPLYENYEVGMPECGFLFPAFSDRSGDIYGIDIFQADAAHPHDELWEEIIRGNTSA